MLLPPHQPGEQPLFRNIQPGVSRRGSSTTGETVRSSDSDKHYLDTLDQLIADLVARKLSNFADLSRSCAAAWPRLIADRLTKLKLWLPVTTQAVSFSLPSYSPELHRAFGEWVFFPHLRRGALRRALSHYRIERVAILLARRAQAAATTSCHVCIADVLKVRCVLAEVR